MFMEAPPTATYTLSLHDALPIWHSVKQIVAQVGTRQTNSHPFDATGVERVRIRLSRPDRKSTRLNSSHQIISYAVFCLKKKTNNELHAYAMRSALRSLCAY